MNDSFVAKLIKNRRLELGISETHLAEAFGINLSWYSDIESYSDEFFTNISLGQAKILCQHLDLQLFDLAEMGFPELPNPNLDAPKIPIHELFKQKRTELGLSIEALADMIGFTEETILEIESREFGIDDALTIDVVIELIHILGIPANLIF